MSDHPDPASNGEMHFEDFKPVSVPFSIGNRKYSLREADTAVYKKYRDSMEGSIKVDAETKQVRAGASTAAQIQALVSSVTEIIVTGDGKRTRRKITADIILAWAPAVTKWAFEKLCEISPGFSVNADADARKKREDELKNSPAAGMDNSDTAETTESLSTS